ncbi:MAG: hypothetical protein J1E38_09040 [Paramuribaculum sp.]|nr:hypothetical protein [Paramuribaculum sp.]
MAKEIFLTGRLVYGLWYFVMVFWCAIGCVRFENLSVNTYISLIVLISLTLVGFGAGKLCFFRRMSEWYEVGQPKKIGFKLIILGALVQTAWFFGLSLYIGNLEWFIIQTIVWAGLLYGTWKILNVKKNGVSWWSLCK